MSHYFTPIKPSNRNTTKTTTQGKAQDWICLICNNLNFSFRKKCNRCKTQTRLKNENQVATAYSQYYYENSEGNDRKSPLSDSTNLFTPQRQDRQVKNQEENLTKLAKQYCPKNLQTALDKQIWSHKKQNFANEFWQNINVHEFDEFGLQEQEQETSDEQNRKSSEQMEAELERMFTKILLQQQ